MQLARGKQSGKLQIRVRQSACAKLWSVVRPVLAYTYMTRWILQLAICFAFSAVFEAMVDLVILKILAHPLGTDAMIAYTMTSNMRGETEM